MLKKRRVARIVTLEAEIVYRKLQEARRLRVIRNADFDYLVNELLSAKVDSDCKLITSAAVFVNVANITVVRLRRLSAHVRNKEWNIRREKLAPSKHSHKTKVPVTAARGANCSRATASEEL